MTSFVQFGLGDWLQIAILATTFYFIFTLFRGTRSAQILYGLLVPLLLLIIASGAGFEVISWLLRQLAGILAIAVVVIFQPEIRQALAIIGRRRSGIAMTQSATATRLDHLVQAVEELARDKIGALIALEREISLDGYRQNGTLLNAPLVPRLLTALFFPRSPLHDGGIIVRDNTIVAARCIFPLLTSDAMQHYGMRHRAALGLSEETDAIIIVVSEERGSIALAFQGRLLENLTPPKLRRYLEALSPKEGLMETWRRILSRIELDGDKEPENAAAGHHKEATTP